MRAGAGLLQLLSLLLALVLPFLAGSRPASAKTTVTATGPCAVTVTINIEIHGPAATQALADRWKRNIEGTWNGPSHELAQRIAEQNGLDLNTQRAEVDRLAREFLQRQGMNCSYVNCCNICFVANVRLRQGDTPTPDHHQIEAVPEFEERIIDGRTERVWNRPFVRGLGGQEASTSGRWEDNTGWPPEAHETGHLMGLDDQYHDEVVTDPATGQPVIDPATGNPRTRSVPNAGHENDIMANDLAFPFEDAINEILKKGNAECNCCEDPSRLYQRFGIAWRPATDSIITCNLEILRDALHDLEGQRRDLDLTRVSAADRYDLGKKLDDLIARIRRAIEDCPEEGEPPTTTGMIPGGVPAGGPGVVVDGNTWCTYWPWDPVTVPPPTEVPPTVPPPTEPPTAPPTEVPPTVTPPPTVPPTVPPTEERPPTVTPPPTVPPTVERPPTVPPTEERPPQVPPTVPPSIVKAVVTDPNTGQPVTGCRLALTSPPPDLPGTRARDDSGYNEDSTQATTGADGTCRLMAGGSPPEFQDGGEMPTVDVEIDLPSFKSYIVKIKIDKSKEAWDNPSTYLEPAASYFVKRKWIVGDIMYVVVNIPEVKEK